MKPQTRINRRIDDDGMEVIDLDLEAIREKRHPWKIARSLKKKKAQGFYSEQDVLDIANKFDNQRDKCLFVLTYICAGRIGEIVRYQKVTWGKKKVRLIKVGDKPKIKVVQDKSKPIIGGGVELSVIKRDIIIEENNARITLRNLKNKQEDSQFKVIPFNLDKSINRDIFQIVKNYLQVLQDDEELFPIGRRQAEKIITKVSGWNPHFIRALRLTHLARAGFTDQELTLFAGWTDSRPSKHYIKLGIEDLIKKMHKENI